jgi:hypothetical protein
MRTLLIAFLGQILIVAGTGLAVAQDRPGNPRRCAGRGHGRQRQHVHRRLPAARKGDRTTATGAIVEVVHRLINGKPPRPPATGPAAAASR